MIFKMDLWDLHGRPVRNEVTYQHIRYKINNHGAVIVYKSHIVCRMSCTFFIVDYGGVCSKFAGLQRSTITDLDFDILNNIDDDVTLSGVGKSSPTNQPTDLLSRNTGFITFSHQGQGVPDIVSKLSLLHEIGHSLGSPVSFLIFVLLVCLYIYMI